ncbi:hypothetical protein F4802DRAFT_606249 [Xylaria palmicola]|nr:hypothetical protein F4802DRAFT_606249 [Xylaria palmicola]
MSSSTSTCLSGFDSQALLQGFHCNAGFFCPNNSDANPPEYCPPTTECLLTRLQTVKNICNQAQGVYEPMVCPPGHYCNPGGKQIATCPSGYFCPLGTVKPIRCSATSICSAGADRELVLEGFIVIFIVDLLILAFLLRPLWPKFRRNMRDAYTLYVREFKPQLSTNCARVQEIEPASNLEVNELWNDEESITEDDHVQGFATSVRSSVGQTDIGLSFGFENISLVLPNGKTILAPQSGHIPKGTIWGMMGPSGAGKSSLVNVLMGKTRPTAGKIYVNHIVSSVSRYKKLIGYVHQNDIIMPECTVRENISHAALIRLPREWTQERRMNHVDKVLSCLNLTNIQHNIVGDQISSSISGGQRKRVSIGIELAAAPIALVLDEPTSGLDATTSLLIMKFLRTLSRLGVTVVCIVHQPRPEILGFLDGVTLLSGGHQVYHGATQSLVGYFSQLGCDISNRPNVADAILDIISGHSSAYLRRGNKLTLEDLVRSWGSLSSSIQATFLERQSVSGSKGELELLAHAARKRGIPRPSQAYLCFIRSLKQQWRRCNSFLLEISVGAIAGLLIGLSLYQLRGRHFQGAYYPPFQILSSALNYTTVPQIGLLASLAIGLAAAAPGVKTFGEEKQLYWREASAGHSRSAYFLGKVFATVPRLAISALHFTTFYCILATPLMPFWRMYLTNLMYFYCIYGLASAVSTAVRREDGPLLAMIVSLIIGVFGGYGPPLYNVREWHLEWLWRLCPGIWLTEAYFDQHLIRLGHLYDLDAAASWTGYTRGRFGVNIVLLLVIGTVYRAATFIGLTMFDRKQQI